VVERGARPNVQKDFAPRIYCALAKRIVFAKQLSILVSRHEQLESKAP